MGDDISNYSYTGVLAWMESEWRRFHREREEWHNERAILCASVNNLRRLLQGSQANEAAASRRAKALEQQLQQRNTSGRVTAVPVDLQQPPVEEPSPDLQPAISALRLPQMECPPPEKALKEASPPSPPLGSGSGPPRDMVQVFTEPSETGSDAESASSTSPTNKARGGPASTDPATTPSATASAVASSGGSATGTVVRQGSKGQLNHSSQRTYSKPLRTLPPDSPTPEETGPPSPQAASSPVPVVLPSPGSTVHARRWELRTCVRAHFAAVRCGCWCGEGTLMVTGGDDHVIKLWDARRVLKGKDREEPLFIFRGHTSPVLAVRAHKDEVLGAAWDGRIRIWKMPQQDSSKEENKSVTSGSTLLEEHTDAVWGLAVLPDSPELCFSSVGADGKMVLWRRSPSGTISPDLRFAPATAMDGGSFAPIHCHLNTSSFLVSYTNLRDPLKTGVASYSISGGEVYWNLQLPSRPTSLSISSYGLGAVGMEDGSITILNSGNGEVINSVKHHTAPVTDVDVTKEVLFSSSHDGRVLALDMADSLNVIQQLPSPHSKRLGENVHVVFWHPERAILVTAGADSAVAWYTVPASK